MKSKFFSTAEKFREWLEKNHATATEIDVGFHKKSSGKKSITYPEALDEALRQCHTLKGLAATVEAWGLSGLGADLEKLLELAGSWILRVNLSAGRLSSWLTATSWLLRKITNASSTFPTMSKR